jgi:hypothetical protein
LLTKRDSQDCLQHGYIKLAKVLLWLHKKLASINHKEPENMLRKVSPDLSPVTPLSFSSSMQLKQGMDSAHGDNTGTLKDLRATWVNVEYSPTPLIRPGNKHH